MRVCAISPQYKATKTEILDFVSELDHDLVVLPGGMANHPNVDELSSVLNENVHIFVETGFRNDSFTPWLVSRDSYIKMPKQCFVSKPKAMDLDQLQKVWNARTHIIGGVRVSFALCGEIDAFHWSGEVKKGRNLPFEVIVNPTHYMRGHWNWLQPKLENLSKGTVAIHNANNNKNHKNVTTHLRIYESGMVAPRFNEKRISWSECEVKCKTKHKFK